jgi:hypothetical protein
MAVGQEAHDLIAEAAVLGRYLVGRPPSQEVAARYADAEQQLGHAGAAANDPVVIFARRHPRWLGPLDAASALLRPNGVLRAKVIRMAAVLEACPDFADQFLPSQRSMFAAVAVLARVALTAGWELAAGVVVLKLAESRACGRT